MRARQREQLHRHAGAVGDRGGELNSRRAAAVRAVLDAACFAGPDAADISLMSVTYLIQGSLAISSTGVVG